MNGLPATIVIRHLMAGPAPIAQRPAPSTFRRPSRRGAPLLVLRVAVPVVVIGIVVSFFFALASSGQMGA